MWKRIILWIITVLWMVVIFAFSSQPATKSADLSRKVTEKIVQGSQEISRNVESEPEKAVVKLHPVIRKVAHFVLYLALGVLLLHLCLSYGASFGAASLVALCVSALYAVLDELHQHFVPERSFLVTDILLDSVGAAFGIGLVWLGVFLLKKIKNC